MEKLIKKFINGYGDGNGYGNGNGNGDGDGNGNGDGDGDGNGDGYGYGYGYGDGYGDGDGDGNGDGYGDGYGLKFQTYKGNKVYYVDNIPCVFKSVNKDLLFAKVAVINKTDLSSELQFIYKFNGCFAHGKTLREAKADAENKYYSQLDVNERIKKFHETFKVNVKYSAKLFYEWHTTLTGSCGSGKDLWVKERGVDLNSKMTIQEFIELTKNSYGGEIIKKLVA